MSLLSTLGKAASASANIAFPLPAIALNAAGIDTTPGYSATNVARTQLGKITSKADTSTPSKPASSGYNFATAGTGAGGSASGGGAYSSGGGSSAPAVNLAMYDPAIQQQQAALGRLTNVQSIGQANADTAYNQALNQLNQQKALDQQTYDKNTQSTKTDFVGAKNTIGTNAGNSLNSLLRLLGAHGAGGSSAALLSAPQATARQATVQRSGATDTYGKNLQSLDTNWGNYTNSFNQNVSAQGIKHQNDVNAAIASADTQRGGILQQLADLFGKRAGIQGGDTNAAAQPYLNQANQYLTEADNLGRAVPVPQVSPLVYNAPNLANYTTNPNATPTVAGQGQATDYTSPYLAALLGKKNANTAAIGG